MRTRLGGSGFTGQLRLALLLLLLPTAAVALAANDPWTGATNGDWGTSGNWTLGGKPNPNDTAVFNSTFTNQPILGSSDTTGQIWMTGNIGQNVTISSTGGVFSGTGTLNKTGTGTLTLSGNNT